MCIKVYCNHLVAHFPLFAKCVLLDSLVVRHSLSFLKFFFKFIKSETHLGRCIVLRYRKLNGE